mgnify:CR=1 FL=1
MIDQEKHRQAGLKAYAHEMETLKEGTWYIRGCSELRDYFDKIEQEGYLRCLRTLVNRFRDWEKYN